MLNVRSRVSTDREGQAGRGRRGAPYMTKEIDISGMQDNRVAGFRGQNIMVIVISKLKYLNHSRIYV